MRRTVFDASIHVGVHSITSTENSISDGSIKYC